MKNIQKILLTCFLLIYFPDIGFSQSDARWLRYPVLSPDGQTILFNYKGDLYQISAQGGKATPLTLSDSYEFNAVWSSDGKHIAFASDRYGNFDVFVMPATGGQAKRLTFHSGGEFPSSFTTDNQSILFSASRQDVISNVQFPTGLMSELYSVPINGGRVTQVLTTPALNATLNSDGSKLIYHDIKGYENRWRKHHISSVTRDIWSYDFSTSAYQKLSAFEGEDRNPVFASNDDDFYYLSETSGSFNVSQSSLSNPSQTSSVTSFQHHPVRFLSIANDNTLCFSYHGYLYTLKPGQSPKRLSIQIPYDGRATLEKIVPVNSGFTELTIAPSGKEFAYVFRGEIFVSSLESGATKRITNTPWQERSVNFSPDGRSLVFAREVESSWNIYTISVTRKEEDYFYTATLLEEKEIVATPAEEFQPSFSPNGKEIAYLENRVTLKVINLDSKIQRTIMAAEHNYSYSDGDQWYEWSPDGKWFLVQFGHKERIFFLEVGLVSATGNGNIRNLTLSGYSDFYPKWAMDGKMVLFGSDREGLKGENGWSASGDVYGIFFTKKSFDRFNLSKEAFDLLKEKEDEDKKDDKEEATKKKKKDASAKEDTLKPLKFDFENLSERKSKLTVHTSEATDWVLSKDGEKLYYLTRFEGKFDLWETELRTKKTKLFAKIGASRVGMEISKDGDFILVLADGKAKRIDTKEGKIKAISTKGEMLLKQDQERAYIFDHSWRQLREKFYVEDLQGVDWDFYYQEYRPLLAHINNNYDFAEMLSEMLGEMNASHTGSGYRHRPPNSDQTASLGVLYDYEYEGNGLKIGEVLVGGPMDHGESKAKVGHIIEKIDGESITPQIDFYKLLNRKVDKNVLLSFYDTATNKRWDERIKPVSLGAENQLLYKRWVNSRRTETEKLSKGKLGYVHVRGMNDASMRTVIDAALGRHVSAEALVVDTRFNGGGNLHDVLSDFLNGKVYLDIIPHGQFVGSQPMTRWNKPSIVLMGESNYSDAHLFPMAYKIKQVGKTLGMPVPGTGTFVWWETQIDPTIYFGIPMGGWRGPDGKFLENNQMEPDVKIANEPGQMATGKDQQLEAGIKELLGQ